MSKLIIASCIFAAVAMAAYGDEVVSRPTTMEEGNIAHALLNNRSKIDAALKKARVIGDVGFLSGEEFQSGNGMQGLHGYNIVLTQCQPNLPMPCRPLGNLSITTIYRPGGLAVTNVDFKKN